MNDNNMSAPRVALVVVFLVVIAGMSFAIPRHFNDPAWPVHAINHAAQTLIWINAFCLVGIWLVLKPLAEGQKWAWQCLWLISVSLFGGYFIPVLCIEGGGAPGPTDDIFFGTAWFVASVALLRLRNSVR